MLGTRLYQVLTLKLKEIITNYVSVAKENKELYESTELEWKE